MHLCVGVCGGQGTTSGVTFQVLSALFLGAGSGEIKQAVILASEPRRSACPCLHIFGVVRMCHYGWLFIWVLGD